MTIVDIGTDPANPKVVASWTPMNSVFGPPTHLAITPNGQLALVANSHSMVQIADGPGKKLVPDNKLHVFDLTAKPPELIDTVAVGGQPSGIAINRAGNLALIASRADKSISVLAIEGKQVKLTDTVTVGEGVANIAFTPDGRRALATKLRADTVALLQVDGQRVTYTRRDLEVGLFPNNLEVTPDGKLALTADHGNVGGSVGRVCTVSVIDLGASPPRVFNKVTFGDEPHGLAINPNGRIAVSILRHGSNNATSERFYNRNGVVLVLKIDGKEVRKVGEVEVRGLPEGVVFSPDGNWLYVGNYNGSEMSVLRVGGDRVTDTGTLIRLPGRPMSMRGRTQEAGKHQKTRQPRVGRGLAAAAGGVSLSGSTGACRSLARACVGPALRQRNH